MSINFSFLAYSESKDNDTSDHHPSTVLTERQPQSSYPKATTNAWKE